jgi:hypothetical protein
MRKVDCEGRANRPVCCAVEEMVYLVVLLECIERAGEA